jgi:hypothetical protein
MKRKLSKFIATLHIAILSSFVIGNATAGTEDRTFELQRLELVEKVERILINNKICQSKSDCQGKKLAFISPADSGINVKTYGFDNADALQQIITECARYFFESNGVMKITIEIFSVTKQVELNAHFWKAIRPTMNVQFKGEK